MSFPVRDLGKIGILTDGGKETYPLNAWTAGRNIRFIDNAVEKFKGHTEVYSGTLWAPWWLLPVPYGTTFFWLYASDTKVGGTDGLTHADLTRAAGDYTTDLNVGWTGTLIEGIPVISNGADVPQMWNTPLLATKLAALTAWPATYTARAMRSLKRYLVGLGITKGAVSYPHMIKWSHQAPTGGVPTSWDETDVTLDAGEWTLPSEGGILVDGFALRDDLILYKENQTWKMQYVAGLDIFRFTKIFESFGALSRRCAAEFFAGKQLVFTGDDLVVHDGVQAESVLRERSRQLITDTIDSTYYQRSFLVVNYAKFEVWVCFPETGQNKCTKALVWNWKTGAIGLRDMPNAGFAAAGVVSPIAVTDTWGGAVGDWSTDTSAWGDRSYDPTKRSILIAGTADTKLYQAEQTQQNNGSNMSCYVERDSLGFPLKADAPPDFSRMKQINNIWPYLKGTAGGVVNFYLGRQSEINGAITYSAAKPFVIGTTKFLDCSDVPASPLHALKFESNSDVEWKLDGYEIEVVDRGMFYG